MCPYPPSHSPEDSYGRAAARGSRRRSSWRPIRTQNAPEGPNSAPLGRQSERRVTQATAPHVRRARRVSKRALPGLRWKKRPGERPDERPGERPDERPGERPDERPGERPDERPGERPDERPGERPDERPGERPDERPGERPDERPGERAAAYRPFLWAPSSWRTGIGSSTTAQARTTSRLTLSVCVRGKSVSGQKRQATTRWWTAMV